MWYRLTTSQIVGTLFSVRLEIQFTHLFIENTMCALRKRDFWGYVEVQKLFQGFTHCVATSCSSVLWGFILVTGQCVTRNNNGVSWSLYWALPSFTLRLHNMSQVSDTHLSFVHVWSHSLEPFNSLNILMCSSYVK